DRIREDRSLAFTVRVLREDVHKDCGPVDKPVIAGPPTLARRKAHHGVGKQIVRRHLGIDPSSGEMAANDREEDVLDGRELRRIHDGLRKVWHPLGREDGLAHLAPFFRLRISRFDTGMPAACRSGATAAAGPPGLLVPALRPNSIVIAAPRPRESSRITYLSTSPSSVSIRASPLW